MTGKGNTAVAESFAALLDAHGIASDERISICQKPPNGVFGSTIPVNRADAVALAAAALPKADRWYGINPLAVPAGYRGRGKAEHVTRCVGLPGDLDVKAGRASGLDGALDLAKRISDRITVNPVSMVPSGYGLHGVWRLDPDDDAWTLDTEAKRAAATVIYRRAYRLMLVCALEEGWEGLDNVCELARVLRVPRTQNYKKPDAPTLVGDAQIDPLGPHGVLGFDELSEILDRYDVAEMPHDRETFGDTAGIEADPVLDPGQWQWGSTTPYVAKMVPGWGTDTPKNGGARHNWMISQCIRLHAAHRCGRISQDDYQKAALVLHDRFHWLLRNGAEPRCADRAEWIDAWAWTRTKVSHMTDERAAEEIGGQTAPAAVSSAPSVSDVEEFWKSSPQLRYIRDYARSKLVGPWSPLGGVLARRVGQVHPKVVLPATVSSQSSLNLNIGLVGKPSAGKGFGPGRHAYPELKTSPEELGVGSGEGVAHQFMRRTKDPNDPKNYIYRRLRWSVLFTAEEIDTLTALCGRSASTISSQLRKAWSGEPLGFAYVDKDKALPLPEHSYRLCVLTGVQPNRAESLLDESTGGLPQRFLYLPVNDPDAPDQTPRVPDPQKLPGLPTGWGLPGMCDYDPFSEETGAPVTPSQFIEVGVGEWLATAIRDDRRAGLRDESYEATDADLMTAHRNLMRLRAAAALMVLEGRTDITVDDWDRAGLMLAVSDTTVTRVREAIRAKSRSDNLAAGWAAAARQKVITESAETSGVGKASARIVAVLGKNPGGAWWSDLRRDMGVRHRDYAEEALDQLAAAGVVRVEDRTTTTAKGAARKGQWVVSA